MVALLLLSYRCLVTVNVLWLFLTTLWVGLQCVIVVFPDHTRLPFALGAYCNLTLREENQHFCFNVVLIPVRHSISDDYTLNLCYQDSQR